MTYYEYHNAKKLALQTLIDEKVTSLPILTSKICRNLGIVVKLFKSPNNESGYSFIINGQPYILVNELELPSRQRFTIAHELGHILLGHVSECSIISRACNEEDKDIETQANVFASRLLAPSCILLFCNLTSTDDIKQLCNISEEASEFRLNRINYRKNCNILLNSPLEIQLSYQFLDFIKKHRFIDKSLLL